MKEEETLEGEGRRVSLVVDSMSSMSSVFFSSIAVAVIW